MSGHKDSGKKDEKCRPDAETGSGFSNAQPKLSSLREAMAATLLKRVGLTLLGAIEDLDPQNCRARARDDALGMDVWVKIFTGDISRMPEFRERLHYQVVLSRHVGSPALEKVLRVEEIDGSILVVSEYIKGRTLGDIVEKEGPMKWSRARGMFLELCGAIEAVHSCDIVHRDLKPDHLMIEDEGRALKVLDLTLARPPPGSGRKHTTLDGSVMGSPEFMAPEQACGRKVDPRADIYSIGSVMYYALSGKPPFVLDTEKGVAEAWMEIGLKIIREPPVPLNVNAPLVPRKVSDLVMKCLAKDPAERFQSVEELKDAILGC